MLKWLDMIEISFFFFCAFSFLFPVCKQNVEVEGGEPAGLTGAAGQSDSQGGRLVVVAAAVHAQAAVLRLGRLGWRCG